MGPIESSVVKMEAQLEQWGAKLDGLVAKAGKAGTEAKSDYHDRLDELKAKREKARERLTEAKAAGAEKWDTLKDGFESAWKEIETAFEKISN